MRLASYTPVASWFWRLWLRSRLRDDDDSTSTTGGSGGQAGSRSTAGKGGDTSAPAAPEIRPQAPAELPQTRSFAGSRRPERHRRRRGGAARPGCDDFNGFKSKERPSGFGAAERRPPPVHRASNSQPAHAGQGGRSRALGRVSELVRAKRGRVRVAYDPTRRAKSAGR